MEKRSSGSDSSAVLHDPTLAPIGTFVYRGAVHLSFSSSVGSIVVAMIGTSANRIICSRGFTAPRIMFVGLSTRRTNSCQLSIAKSTATL